MKTDLIYIDHDNEIDLVLLSDRVPQSLAAVTRAVLSVGATAYDSAILGYGAGQPFDPTVTGTWTNDAGIDVPVEILRLNLGPQSPPAGNYGARLVVYDPPHPNGTVWADGHPLVVRP